MRISRELILAAMLLAGPAFSQTEQWLDYHTSAETRGYHQVELTTNAPTGVVLPKLGPAPYFARWSTPMDPSGGRWLCLDRTRKSGPYDRLFIDSNGNGRLDDKKPISARLDSYEAMFAATPIVFKGEDGPITYHLAFRFYQYERNAAQLLASSAGWYEGMVKFEGVKKRFQLIDANVNGSFNDISRNAYDSDRVTVEGDKTVERFLGKMLEVEGKFYQIEAARDGAFVKLTKAENVGLGEVRVAENIRDFSAYGENGHFVRKPVKGAFTLPIGEYRIFRWSISRKDEQGAEWTLAGYSFPDKASFSVAADKPASLEIGEPVQAVLQAKERTNNTVAFSLRFEGKQKESIELLRAGESPRGPKLMLANADGTISSTNTFEFG
jgi:hypothetical protein